MDNKDLSKLTAELTRLRSEVGLCSNVIRAMEMANMDCIIKKLERKKEEDRRAKEEDRRARVEQFVCKVRTQLASMAMQDGPRPIVPIDVSYCHGLGLTPADIPDDLIGAQLIVSWGLARYSEPVVVRLGVSRMEVLGTTMCL